jgi:hypothetical protein
MEQGLSRVRLSYLRVVKKIVVSTLATKHVFNEMIS